jgi:hypothetical protein
MSAKYVKVAIVIAIIVVVAVAVPALAKGPGGGGGGGGGGGKPPSELANNLSVPAIMVANVFTGVTSGTAEVPSALLIPSGLPSSGWEIDPLAYYYVQRVSKWQAQAFTYAGTTVKTGTAAWGDNLSGDAKLKVGSPIRVELGLFDDTGVSLLGYTVVKLEPSKLDRESKYGTLATPLGSTGMYEAIPFAFGIDKPVRIYDSTVTFSIQNVATGAYVVQPGSNPTGEINAGGAITYGYNLRVSTAGYYDITFTIPNVDITGVSAGTFVSSPTGPDTVTLRINVIAGGGGGGKPK